jgi:peptidyl-dipeptidase Dcp
VQPVFSGMTSSDTNPTLQKLQAELAPKFAAHRDAIFLNPKLFSRIKAIYDQRASLHLSPDADYLIERYYKDFVRAGALLSVPTRT